jgi:outer membrane protein OmpA-like peptidoglycan-associated protein
VADKALVGNAPEQESRNIPNQKTLPAEKAQDDQAAAVTNSTVSHSQDKNITEAPGAIGEAIQLPTTNVISSEANPASDQVVLSPEQNTDPTPIAAVLEEKVPSAQPVADKVRSEKDLPVKSNVVENADSRIASVSAPQRVSDVDKKEFGKGDQDSLLYQLSEQQVKKKSGLNKEKSITQVFFKSDSTNIDQAYHDDLKNVVQLLKRYGDEKAYITGYADSSGASNYNHNLSEMRAKAVAAYLEANSIPRQRLIVVGRGVHPMSVVYSGNKNDARKMQRLVEIVFNPSN